MITALSGGVGPGQGARAAAPFPADLTRPIYPYPYTAKYVGGDIRLAASYVQGPAPPAPANLGDWAGAKLYRPGHNQWCTPTATGLSRKSTR